MNKMKTLFLISLFLIGFVGTTQIVSVTAAEKETGEVYETFMDLLGTVNYTYYADGSQYEGKLSSLFAEPAVKNEQVSFAISIGYSYVYYWTMPDGSVPTKIEQMYGRDAVAIPHILFDRSGEGMPDNSFGGLQLQQATGSDNLTVDTLVPDETKDIYSLGELIANSSALVSQSLVDQVYESKYEDYDQYLLNFQDSDLLYSKPDPSDEPTTQMYGTDNLTSTVYIWLARYIEDKKGYNAFTVDIDDNTENITSEAVSVYMNQEAVDVVRQVVDDALDEAGVTSLSLGSIGLAVSKKIKGTMSFAGGIATSMLKQYDKVAPAPLKSTGIGGKLAKQTLSAGMAVAMAPARAALFGGKFVSSGIQKTGNFLATQVGKVAKGPFSFLGGFSKIIQDATSFLAKYWWVALVIIGLWLALPQIISGVSMSFLSRRR